ncbi:nitroreductase [Candidatus Peregrinibacteria bacterium CG_4_9_14_0_2_um_filter_53_11]|nr:MAG: nitroreductase [Candidatus Peregrinibacteria bacterium CG_4_9_14_0_2_um_filter_53_11]
MKRTANYPISSALLNRWSPRALSGETLSDAELMPLFEAARWAPSSYNGQPWRFVYAKRDSAAWDTLFGLMVEFNQSWAKNAAALVVVVSRTTFEHNGELSVTHSFDCGAAWENLALEAEARGLVAHGMQGFDYGKAKSELGVPEDYSVECMIAIGKPGKKEDLPKDLQEREFPSDRKPLEDIIMEGKFRA